VIDLSALAFRFGWSGDVLAKGYVRFVQSGSDTIVQVETDGGANRFSTLATLSNVNASSLSSASISTQIMVTDYEAADALNLSSPAEASVRPSAIVDPFADLVGRNEISGTEQADTLAGEEGAEPLGGGGVASFFSTSWSNVVVANAGIVMVLNAVSGEVDRLEGIEALQFTDVTLEAANLPQFRGLDYIAGNDDLAIAFGANPDAGFAHFVKHGFLEGRLQDQFDGLQYLASYDDLIRAFGTDEAAAATHFIRHGIHEGRARDSFDGLEYVASHGDLIRAFGANEEAAARHYVSYGLSEGRARDTFDAEQYLRNYTDLAAAFGTNQLAATLHYIEHGYFEGRTDHPGDFPLM
jgi:hypothetical protein